MLRDESGLWIEDKHQLDVLLKNHFAKINTSSGRQINGVFNNIISEVVTEEENLKLVKMSDVEEIKSVLFSMNPWGSPGLDGYPPGVFQTYWNLVETEVVELVKRFLQTGKLPDSLNESFIFFIPKVDNPVTPVDFRAISLSNALYKLISKNLSLRLKNVLNKIISPNQYVFIPKRQIVDNVVIVHEMLHSMETSKYKKGYLALKLYLSKAFDKMKWNFIIFMFKNLGFSQRRCNLIYECISTVKSTVLLNGIPGIQFCPTRGLHQGDSISPYLFITALEGLSRADIAEMQCFKFPKVVLDEYDKLQRDFWWDKDNPKNPFYLKAWDSIRVSKYAGGIGIRDPHMVNVSLLAKLGWRLIHNQDALWVGNGRSINIALDNWIAGMGPLADWHHNELKYVSDLIRENGSWDRNLIDSVFNPIIANRIKAIHIDINNQDRIRWEGRRDGEFSTKSSYNILTHENSSNLDNFLLHLWRLNLLPRVILIVWKMAADVLILRSKVYDVLGHFNPYCMLCMNDIRESSNHLFRECSFTRTVWSGLGFQMPNGTNDFLSWVKSWFSPPLHEWKEIFSIICWKIWKYRNMVVFQGEKPNPIACINLIKIAIDGWALLMKKENVGICNRNCVNSRDINNIMLANRNTRRSIYTDASFDKETGEFGVGLVLWINDRIVDIKIFAGFTTSSKCGESLAVKEALEWVEELNLHNVKVLTDCKNVENFLGNKPSSCEWRSKGILS
ncbi:uncharacterized protein LOC113295500 [Papaver somniferum]|uniref:uncharacterized protein LOC113295500 n=1 Tax=Papaver somniferum TaxID=3469 RepID=UPI000E705804|nr:uncharacterized protein LOC113295500 [Papaver somniferum]